MSLEVEATYENGVLKLDEALPFDEKQRVTVIVKPQATGIWSHGGSFKWTGDPEVLRMIAEDPEFGIAESP